MISFQNPLNFLDFCSGIGGGRIGLENLGMNCLGFRKYANIRNHPRSIKSNLQLPNIKFLKLTKETPLKWN